MPYKINKNFFDKIDTEEKAYWIGFVWCDGYLGHRKRTYPNGKLKEEYNLKLSLSECDESHLNKYTKSLDSTHPIHTYYYKSNFGDGVEKRVFITNTHIGKVLSEKYGMIPHRVDVDKLIDNIPDNLINHFIRGIFDAEGYLSGYQCLDRGYLVEKRTVQFTTYEKLLEFIEKHFYNIGLTQTKKYKKYKRHKEEGRDGVCRTLTFSGKIQAEKVLNYIYKNATIYLDRKYEKYKKIYG